MLNLQGLTERINNFLNIEAISDYCPNGLQVSCRRNKIEKIALAVTASLDAIEQAVQIGADALIVHHGYFWKNEEPTLTGLKYHRIEKLLQNDIALLAYHLPLDIHPVVGNNVMLAKKLGIEMTDTFKPDGKLPLLASGNLASALSRDQFAQHCAKIFAREPLVIKGGEQLISKVAWCTGAAQDFIEDAKRLGADAYISGEVSERTFYQAKELGIHYFACGHHATERYGIQALGEWITRTLGFKTHFIDIDNPV